MILDHELHRSMLLEMFKQMQFGGQHIDAVYELRKAIIGAAVLSTPESGMTPERQARAEMLAGASD